MHGFFFFIYEKILEDEGAAKVGVVETTRTIQSYAHPSYPNLVFYDLPGLYFSLPSSSLLFPSLFKVSVH
jgi:hypothetical protein